MTPARKATPKGFERRIADAYDAGGTPLELGAGMLDGRTFAGAKVRLPASMANRHGLIAGATGTGKTKTLQLLAEQLSAAGVPVFAADIKGDLSGLARPGERSGRIDERCADLGVAWDPSGFPVGFLSLGGHGPGVPVRATVSSFGPELLAKVMSLNDTQTSSLNLVFHYADAKALPLLDLSDLRALLQYLTSDEGKGELKSIGGLAASTTGVLLREIVGLETQGAADFFGEPELDVQDLMRTTPDGRGVVNCLELAAVQDKPRLFSTFLMWLLAELFEQLPEAGDLDKPKLVFFFDEAHLLFQDASKDFLEQVTQTVRLIRSKGVGVFFVTQLPDDVPPDVLAQLGSRVQHALRAFTPRDAQALRAAVTTYPKTKDYDLEEALTHLGIGEAMVTVLSPRGTPTPVVWTRMLPPRSLMAAVDEREIDAIAREDPLWERYAAAVDRDSAREMLARKLDAGDPEVAEPRQRQREPAPRRPSRRDENAVVGYLKSREGRQMINTVARGVFGLLRKRR